MEKGKGKRGKGKGRKSTQQIFLILEGSSYARAESILFIAQTHSLDGVRMCQKK